MRAIFVVMLFISQLAFAEDVQVTGFQAFGGRCNTNNVQLLTNGNAFSVLFNEFGINMPAGQVGDGIARTEVCQVWIDFKIPTGKCLARLEQVFSGGVIKSKNSLGYLSIAYAIPGIAGSKLTQWNFGDEIQPEDADSLFTINLSQSASPYVCVTGKVRYVGALTYSAVRYSYSPDFFISNVDSQDSEIQLRLKTQ